MEVVTIEKKTYEAMMECFRILTAKVDALCRECDERRMGRWLDNQDVCQILNISLRTLQTYRDNHTLPTLQDYRNVGRIPFIKLGGKVLYREEDVEKLLQENYRPRFEKP